MQNITFPFAVQLAGDSIWGYEGPQTVTVTAIDVYKDEDGYTSVSVAHDAKWNIYTDTGFESAISTALGYDVQFTEQGMQDDGYRSHPRAPLRRTAPQSQSHRPANTARHPSASS